MTTLSSEVDAPSVQHARTRISLALVHHPVLDAAGGVTTTAGTNLDVHDLGRSARTYGCDALYVVHPVEAQRVLVERIRDHWLHGSSGRRIPDRKQAVELVRVVPRLEDAVLAMGGEDAVELWVTAARPVAPPLSFEAAKRRLSEETAKKVLIIFGTGWGLAPAVISKAAHVLPPVSAAAHNDYNHLSVRAACAIVLDRLLGDR